MISAGRWDEKKGGINRFEEEGRFGSVAAQVYDGYGEERTCAE
jgi:hypothetical protein